MLYPTSALQAALKLAEENRIRAEAEAAGNPSFFSCRHLSVMHRSGSRSSRCKRIGEVKQADHPTAGSIDFQAALVLLLPTHLLR
jgi:hypothetical protein